MEKIVLIGAGSAVFTKGLVNDLISLGMEAELRLVDIDSSALEIIERVCRKMILAREANVTLSATVDRREALKGATAVVCTIAVGGRRAWEKDVFIPRKYGLYQPVGDSVMPGGVSRSMRMIPAMVDIAKDVLDLCPNALFFNYSNPMSPICSGVRKATGANIVGLCHGVVGTARYLSAFLDVPGPELEYNAVGINHLTWFTSISSNGKDLMPALKERARRELAALPRDESLMDYMCGDYAAAEFKARPICWNFVEQFDAFPAPGDRHVAEFYPQLFPMGQSNGKKLGVDCYSFEETVAKGEERFAQMREMAFAQTGAHEEWFGKAGGEHEQVMDIIHGIRTGSGKVFSANLPNQGQVPNLPKGAILESPATATKNGLVPQQQSQFPANLSGNITERLAWTETVVDAALEGSREKFVQALVLDGWVDSFDTASKMASELLEAQKEHLPQFFGNMLEEKLPAEEMVAAH